MFTNFAQMRSTLFILASALYVSGCVTVWGEAHKVKSEDENGIKIQYDSSLTSSARTSAMARNHCKKFGKTAEPMSAKMPGLLLGIIEETYACVTPESKK
ncbi:MAG: hypothetical protein V4857_12945 [Pseudomonadota bacterium]